MSYSYTLSHPYLNNVQNPFYQGISKYDMPVVSDYNYSFPTTFNNSNNFTFSPNGNNTSIFTDNNPSLTYNPNAKSDIIDNQSVLDKPENTPLTLAEPVEVADEETFTGACVGGGIMAATMAIPKAITLKDSINATNQTSKFLGGAIKSGETMAQAAKSAEVTSAIFNSFRLEEAIKGANRSAEETGKILKKLANLRTRLKSAQIAGDAVKCAEIKAQMETLVSLSKKPGWLARLWNKTKFWSKSAPKAGLTLTEITPKIQAAGEAAAKTAKAITTAEIAAEGSKLAKGANWVKTACKAGGFWLMAGIEALAQIEEVTTAFSQGGTEEGVKQTAKSVTSVVASAGGWCIGAKAGAGIGASIGTMICPGIGTAIGGAIGGILGGVIGSWGLKKAAKAVTGESYTEKHAKIEATQKANEEAAQKAQKAQATPNTQDTTTTSTETSTSSETQKAQDIINKDKMAALNRYLNGTSSKEEKEIFDAEWNEIMRRTEEKLGAPDIMTMGYC